MSIFGFGQSAEIAISLDGEETRRSAEIRTEAGRKEKHLLYFDGETVSGRVIVSLKKSGVKMEHQGIRIEFIGAIGKRTLLELDVMQCDFNFRNVQ